MTIEKEPKAKARSQNANEKPLTIADLCLWYGCSAEELRSALEKNHVREIVQDQIDVERSWKAQHEEA